MLRGLYSVASAMEAASRNQELVADNLAHVATPGYRRQGSLFEFAPLAFDDLASATQNPVGARNPDGYTNFESGPLQQTSNPYDMAIVGNAFFVVQGPNGPLYTRNGAFERTPSGQLALRGSGYLVGGGVNVPPTATTFTVGADGYVYADGSQVGQLQLASFDQLQSMRRVGPTLFAADSPQTPAAGSVRIEQGYREGSNVQPVQEMVSMMVGMRQYEAAEKALRAISDAVGQNTRYQQ